MNEIRVMRLIREMRCDPVTRWFEALFGISGDAPEQVTHQPAPVIETTPAAVEGEETESWLR